MRIGILGGNFNPVITPTSSSCQIQQLLNGWSSIDAENEPPHVDTKTTISAKHRVEMLRLALQDYPKLTLNLSEIEAGWQVLYLQYHGETDRWASWKRVFFIIGGDMVDYLEKMVQDWWPDAIGTIRGC